MLCHRCRSTATCSARCTAAFCQQPQGASSASSSPRATLRGRRSQQHWMAMQPARCWTQPCGSGAFLVQAACHLRQKDPAIALADLLARVRGSDLQPLAVVLARANVPSGRTRPVRKRHGRSPADPANRRDPGPARRAGRFHRGQPALAQLGRTVAGGRANAPRPLWERLRPVSPPRDGCDPRGRQERPGHAGLPAVCRPASSTRRSNRHGPAGGGDSKREGRRGLSPACASGRRAAVTRFRARLDPC